MLLIANTGVLALAAAALLFVGLARALPDANMIPILFHFVDRRHRGTALGFFYACGTTAGGILIYVGGALRDAHIDIIRMFYAGAECVRPEGRRRLPRWNPRSAGVTCAPSICTWWHRAGGEHATPHLPLGPPVRLAQVERQDQHVAGERGGACRHQGLGAPMIPKKI